MDRRLSVALISLGTLAPLAALAQSRDYGNVAATGLGAGLMGGMLLFMLFIVALNIGFFIFWIFMLLDCLKREWPEKNTWIIALVVSLLIGFHWLSSILYYFMIKRNGVGSVAGQNVTPPPAGPTGGK